MTRRDDESNRENDGLANSEWSRRAMAPAARGSALDVSGIVALLAPDVEWSEPENPFNPAAGTRRGHAGFLDWLRVGHAAEEILVLEPRQFLADDTSVAVVGHSKCLRSRRVACTRRTLCTWSRFATARLRGSRSSSTRTSRVKHSAPDRHRTGRPTSVCSRRPVES